MNVQEILYQEKNFNAWQLDSELVRPSEKKNILDIDKIQEYSSLWAENPPYEILCPYLRVEGVDL